ncbi:MAG: hypothetical protein ABI627_17720 [Polyangiaceae bacterium]
MTPSARLDAKRTPLSEWRRSVQRERALIALFDLGRQKTYGLRAARLYAFGVFLTYAIAISLAKGAGQAAVIHGFVRAALVALSWVVGALATLGATQALAEHAEYDSLAALAVQRGHSGAALLRARTLAAAQRIARLVALPALLLVVVGLMRGAALPWACAVAPAVLVYACVLGLTLAVLAHFAAELAPTHPRALLLALVLGPLLFSQVFPAVPSFPQFFSWLLARLLDAGAALT